MSKFEQTAYQPQGHEVKKLFISERVEQTLQNKFDDFDARFLAIIQSCSVAARSDFSFIPPAKSGEPADQADLVDQRMIADFTPDHVLLIQERHSEGVYITSPNFHGYAISTADFDLSLLDRAAGRIVWHASMTLKPGDNSYVSYLAQDGIILAKDLAGRMIDAGILKSCDPKFAADVKWKPRGQRGSP